MNQEYEMNDESSQAQDASHGGDQSQQSNKRKRNKNRNKNRGGANAPEESKEPARKQFQPKKGQGQAENAMMPGPTNKSNWPTPPPVNSQPPRGLNLDNSPVATATEEGFSGPIDGWFDGKFSIFAPPSFSLCGFQSFGLSPRRGVLLINPLLMAFFFCL